MGIAETAVGKLLNRRDVRARMLEQCEANSFAGRFLRLPNRILGRAEAFDELLAEAESYVATELGVSDEVCAYLDPRAEGGFVRLLGFESTSLVGETLAVDALVIVDVLNTIPLHWWQQIERRLPFHDEPNFNFTLATQVREWLEEGVALRQREL